MKVETFFENFGQLADAPNGVQKLRELILQLAVQGKLVEQDPNDEPASVLLEQIATEKERLIQEKKIKKSDALPQIEADELPFDLPRGWAWVRLRELGEFCGGMTPSTNHSDYWGGEVSWVSPKDMKSLRITNSELAITELALSETRLRLLPKRSLLIVARSGILKRTLPVAINDIECVVNQDIKVIIPHDTAISEYLQLMLRGHESLILKELVKGGMTVQSLKYDEFEVYPFPLPPLAEQHRIVAKVDQLMALCDELEARQQKQQSARVRLNNAALEGLLAARAPEEFAAHWQRICDNFDLLYDAPETVGRLREAVLQLAVQGKLVPQDPNDEPASVLLEKIRAEKKRLVDEKGIKKNELLPPIEEHYMAVELPNGWAWARFPEIGEFGRGKSKHRPRNDPKLYKNGRYRFVQTGDVARANRVIETYTGLYNEEGLSQSKMWPKGTMCITIAANIADSGILGFDACFPDSVVGLIPSSEIGDAAYFEYFMRTAKDRLLDYAPSTAQKNINIGILETVLIPLPPLNEIRRIVAKVDQLMALCDDLEAKLRRAQAAGSKLATAAVQHLTAA